VPEPPFVRMIPKHKKYEGAGEKATTFTKKLWIEQADAKAIAEKKPPNVELEEDEDFIDVLNPNSKKEFAAVGDANMRN
ncbi:glutamate--tRNA ligase, cytoplasmic, partial [Tanacetum coccineum]